MNPDPIGLDGCDNLYWFASNAHIWIFCQNIRTSGDCKVGLHEPDMRTGGKPTDVTKVGDKRINSILGGQADRIARDILKMLDETTKITYQLKLKR